MHYFIHFALENWTELLLQLLRNGNFRYRYVEIVPCKLILVPSSNRWMKTWRQVDEGRDDEGYEEVALSSIVKHISNPNNGFQYSCMYFHPVKI